MSVFPAASGVAALCVRRPVLAAVMSLLIVVAGLAALFGAQVRELPNVDRPVITVRTEYPGATPESVDTQVTNIIEGAVARVPGVESISSSSERGNSRVVAEFRATADMNAAAGDVRDAIGAIRRRLPEQVEEPVIVKADADGQAIMQLAIVSNTLPIDELSAIVERRVLDRLSAVEGVADVQAWGLRRPVFHVEVNPMALALRGLTFDDLEATLRGVATDSPAGTLRQGDQSLLVRANTTVVSVEEIGAVYVNPRTRIRDVANVRLGPANRETALRTNGRDGIGVGIIRQAQSNTLAISQGVRAAVADLNEELGDQVEIAVRSDDAIFIRGAVEEVVKTLGVATLVVIAIIFLFFRSARATFIPAITVPVAVIGTFAAIHMMGFSINVLTLLALVLATGIVVDDSIVVIENIERNRALGLGPRAAAVVGTQQVFFAVLATTATLAAVFVPISFFPGTAGRLFSEFGYVLAFAVLLSSFVALTLAPMLASRLLKAPPERTGEDAPRPDLLGRAGAVVSRLYERTLDFAFKVPLIIITMAIIVSIAAIATFRTLPGELTPAEDRSLIFMVVNAPQGASLEFTERKVREIEERISPLTERGETGSVLSVVGRGQINRAFIIVPLTQWDERERSQAQIMAEVRRRISDVIGVQVQVRGSNSLGIRGGGSGLQFALTGSSYEMLAKAAEEFLPTLRERLPGLVNPMLSFDATQPQTTIEIDRSRASDLGVASSSLPVVLQAALEGRLVGELHVNDRAIRMELRANRGGVASPRELENLFVRGGDNALVPLSQFATITETAVAPSLRREGQMRATPMQANLSPGYDMSRAMADVQELARTELPAGVGVRFLGEAAALDQTSRGVGITFAFAIIIVLLVLAAQFESFVSAGVIMATVPFGLATAIFAIALTGNSINIYTQIGLVMLIGLMTKNSILIVEFANQLRDQGASVPEAIREASLVRFRPVMMTLLSTVLGGVPLVLSSGAGAEARQALGWVVVGGLGISAAFTLFLTPVVYALVAGWSKPRAADARRLDEEMDMAARSDRAHEPPLRSKQDATV
ncbi:MAG: efflux RND transporter permease subunit [Beijerinckiaceae bacterium]|nr:efflux RND transporter permease subunit [Beijerinckiaceae bacterium]